MKKLIFIFILSLSVCATNAQMRSAVFTQTTFNPSGTVTNTGSDTMSLTTTNAFDVIGIQPTYLRASGTAAGTMVLYGSIDGTRFVAVGDTLTLSNAATNTGIWTLNAPVYTYYRIITTGGTTVSATTQARANLLTLH